MTYNTIDNDVTMAGGAEGALGRIDKYELRRELGEGGFGTVYLARDTVADVDVAVKGLPPEVKHNESELESIRGNFALVKRLRHPNIVAVTDLHQALSVSYASKDVESKLRVFERDTMVVMDYAPGVTLAQWRRQFPGGKVPLDKAIAVVRQIASALDYAHAQKVLHRDVKPANVMVESADGGKLVARVLDFGLAAEIRSSMGRLSREIRDTSGTRPYMAPEQWKGERQGPATDQYALAAMFYELVAGEVPFASVFDCGDPAVMRLAVTADAPAIPADLPKCVRRALAAALAKKPEERFASCSEFAAAIEGKVKVPHSGSRAGGAGKVIAALAFLAAIGVGGLVYHQNQERQRAEQTGQETESGKGSAVNVGDSDSETGVVTDISTVTPQTSLTRKDVDAIYVEARVQMGACGRLDPSDGFKSRIEDCQKAFDFAGAQYDLGRWAEAALAFTNVVGECKTLIEQSNARDTAKSAAEILAEAIKVAQSAGAKEYAPVRFSSATDLAKRGRGEFGAFKFSDATATYASAKSQFDLAAKEAGLAKQEEARKKREAEEVGPPPVNAGDTIIQSDARRQVRGESLRPERTHVFDGQALNTLTELEKSEGWELLWDGRTFNGWLAVKGGCKEPPQKGWIIKDGSLTMFPVNTVIDGKWSPLPPEEQKLGGGGDIATDKKFREFVFKFDFRLTKNATSGVKYFYDETLNHGTSEEFQIIDCGHPDFNKGKDGNRRSAALYDILPAHADRFLKDVGEWNTGMIVAKGAHVEHWLNGEKVLEYERGSDAFKAAVKASKYASWGVDATGKPQDWGEIPEGRILLEDHTDSMVSFRNLKIKKL